MKKIGILNQDISEVIAGMGHYQQIIVCDAGFPISDGIRRIDLAVTPGYPAFLPVLKAILTELQVEEIVIAREAIDRSPEMYQEMTACFPGIEPRLVPHAEFKEMSRSVKACIRTGECTPYANIILTAGVTF